MKRRWIYARLKKHGPLDDAEMLDLEKRQGRYVFRISGDGFSDALQAVKEAFRHGSEREYDPDTHEWSVVATELSEEKLCNIFGNAAGAFQVLHSQLHMFE